MGNKGTGVEKSTVEIVCECAGLWSVISNFKSLFDNSLVGDVCSVFSPAQYQPTNHHPGRVLVIEINIKQDIGVNYLEIFTGKVG